MRLTFKERHLAKEKANRECHKDLPVILSNYMGTVRIDI